MIAAELVNLRLVASLHLSDRTLRYASTNAVVSDSIRSLRMTAVPGLGNLATDLVGRKSGHCRTWGCNCVRTPKRTNRISIQAFRSERPANSHTEASNGSSRLLNNRRAANRPQQQAERPPRLDRQDEPTANSSRPSLIKRAPGRLLQRGNSSRQLPDADKQTQQLPERQQVSDKQKDSDRKQACRASVLRHPQQSASSHQHHAKSSGKRFSQAAGKLSQKDWQVTLILTLLFSKRCQPASMNLSEQKDCLCRLPQIGLQWTCKTASLMKRSGRNC